MATAHLQLASPETGHPPRGRAQPLESSKLLSNVIVVKISGKLIANIGKLPDQISEAVGNGSKVVLVHGGGKQIDQRLLEKGIHTEKEDGVRITPPKAMPHIVDVMGEINAKIAGDLRKVGVAVCQAGVEGTPPVVYGILDDGCKNCTGRISAVDTDVLKHLLAKKDAVVLSCLARVGNPDDYGFANINADNVASAVAAAMEARKLIALSDKPVLGCDGRSLPLLDHADSERLIASAVIHDGMVPKVRSMLAAAERVGEVLVAGEDADLGGLLSGKHDGATRFVF